MEKLQACVSRLLTWLCRLPGWFQVHLSRLTRVRGIRQRWLMNSVSFLVMVLAVVVIVFGLIVKNYYDSSILSDMESKARTAVNYFSSTSSNYNSADGDYLSAAQDYVSSFQDGTRLELQYLDPEGTVIYSSNGLTISGSVPGTGDINQLQHTQTISAWRGVSPQTGERVTAVSAPLLYNGKLVGILRYVTSMRLVDRQVIILTLIAVILSVSILILVYLSNIYFVRSIVGPVKNITGIARRIAGGSYGIQVEKKFDDEVGDLTDAINDMSLRIKQAESMKQEFISSVSHELRTPLTAITGWAETIMSGEARDEGDVRKGMSIIASEARRLSGMVEELLEFSALKTAASPSPSNRWISRLSWRTPSTPTTSSWPPRASPSTTPTARRSSPPFPATPTACARSSAISWTTPPSTVEPASASTPPSTQMTATLSSPSGTTAPASPPTSCPTSNISFIRAAPPHGAAASVWPCVRRSSPATTVS